MTNKDIELLKKKIEKAEVVSFDIFDTLLLRKTNNPETIFDLIGKHFSFFKFRKYRMDSQTKASIKAWEEHKYPHANIDEIYDHIKRSGEYQLDWDAVKQYEIDIEKDAVVANEEMLDIFHYAKKLGKRVVATSDMYLMASTLEEMLEKCGFIGFDKVYCSADERKAKFNRDLFEAVAVKEAVDYCKVLHIGDKERDDGEFPRSYGMDAFVYNRDVDLSNVSKAISSDIDNGLYNILYNDKRNFWYNFGIEAGGPLYIGLVRWIKDIIGDKKVYFLSRDGYNLYSILKNMGYTNVEYLYMSRRSILLAGITELDDESLKELPPYTKGQRIKDIFDYLCIPSSEVLGYESGGLADENVIIKDDSDIAKVKKLLVVNSDAILQRCKIERENAIEYFSKKGFFEHDSYVFDCGWSGSSQFLLERFKRAINSDVKNYFLYFGIRSTEKSMKQLHLLDYKTFAFDFYNNFTLQRCALDLSVVLIELLFSAPHASVFYYDANGEEAIGFKVICNVKYFFNSKGQRVGKNVKKVIDVSTWQGNIDWGTVKEEGELDGVIIRIGYGSIGTDDKFARNAAACKQYHIPFGVYLYSYAETAAEGKTEAENVIKILKKNNITKLDYPIYLDLESNSATKNLKKSDYEKIVTAFMETMHNAGYDNVKVYSYLYMLCGKLDSPLINPYVDWVAQYYTICQYDGDYSGWQYSSSGKVPGISGRVDMNVWYK